MKLIDKDALKRFYRYNGDCTYSVTNGEIENAPIIDAVEVVRCKDCKKRNKYSCPMPDFTLPDDYCFCSYGEKF